MKKILLFFALTIAACSKDKDCALGYTGSDCDIQITPKSIQIDFIELTKYPPNDNGASWDVADGPDIYIEIRHLSSVIYSTVKNPVFNITSPNYFWAPSTPILLNYPLDDYYFRLYDYDDFSGDDYMGEIGGQLYDSNNKFPSNINIQCQNCKVGFKINVSYNF